MFLLIVLSIFYNSLFLHVCVCGVVLSLSLFPFIYKYICVCVWQGTQGH